MDDKLHGFPKTLIIKVWSPNQWHHHLETCKNANYQPYPRLTEPETLGWSPAICVLSSSPGESDAH